MTYFEQDASDEAPLDEEVLTSEILETIAQFTEDTPLTTHQILGCLEYTKHLFLKNYNEQ